MELAAPLASRQQGFPEDLVFGSRALVAAQDAGVLPEGFLAGVAGNLGELGIHILDGAFAVGDDVGGRAVLDGQQQLCGALLRLLALGDVVDDGVKEGFIFLANGAGKNFDIPDRPIGAPMLEIKVLSRLLLRLSHLLPDSIRG